MQGRMLRLAGAIACLAISIPVFAQYGHPLKGSWSGDWWLVKGKENHILLDFNFTSSGYGNTTLTGVLNPGPDQSPMQKLTLTPPDVITAGKAAIAARDAALAKQAADAAAAAANPAPAPAAPAAPAAGARGTTPAAGAAAAGARGTTPAAGATAAGARGTAPAAGAAGARGATAARGAAPAVKDNIVVSTDPWLLHFEADAKDATGKTVHYVVDGKLKNLGAAYTRVIEGTWKVGAQVGNFKVTRN
jgi:hypothetical protein